MKLSLHHACALVGSALAAFTTTQVAGDVVYWQDHVEAGDFAIAAGDTLVLRGNNTVAGVLQVRAGATLLVDPDVDAFLRVGSIDVYGAFHVGARAQPYAHKAIVELQCNSPFLASDVRRKAVVVRANATLALFGAKGTGDASRTWTPLRETADAGATCIQLDLPNGWAMGDEIVLPSTDFDPHQAEKRTIVGVSPSGCVALDRPLQFMHYGRISEGVDERAEVGLLTRSIVFRGCRETPGVDAEDTADVGGHMLVLEHFERVQVDGVEFENFGQGDQLGRYALHFHLCGRVPDDTFLRNNAIHDSNFRAIVLHGTQNVALERNVAFNITGHAFMLEDGAESDNVIRENLVVLVREKLTHVRLGSDARIALSAFYITNPQNTITDNVVAGVEGAAFWVDTRLQVKGLSYLTGKYDNVHPFKLALGDVSRNRAHAVEVGFKIDSPDLDVFDYPQQTYSPPFMYTPDAMPVIRDFLVHHSRHGGWFRSYRIVLDGWIVGDVTEGVQVLSRGDTSTEAVETYVRNALFVGGTANRGNLVASRWQFVNYLENRSDSAVDRSDDARMGIKLYDGPMYIANTTFRLWYSQPCLNVTNPAIGTRLFNTFLMATAIVASDVVFEKTDVQFYVSDREADGGLSTSMVDALGAISGRAGATLLPDWDYYVTPSCARSAAYGVACPQRYVNLDVVNVDTTTDPTYYSKLRMYRNNVATASDGLPSLAFTGQYIPASSGWLYHPIISPGASYTLQFEHRTPSHLKLRFSYTQPGDVVTLVIAYPLTSQITSVISQNGTSLQDVASLRDTSTACVNCFAFDATRGLLSITVQERAGPAGPSASCSPQGCLSVVVQAVVPSDTAGVSTAQLAPLLPVVAVTDAMSSWRRQSFPFEAAVFDVADNMDWCRVDDPCLHAMDEGNVKMGVLAYYESPCVGVGCFSDTCRYCKLSFSAARVPFPGCPFDPNYTPPTTSADPCAAFASVGNAAAGVEVFHDTTCVNGGGVTGQGCVNDACRFCQTASTAVSANFLSCASFAAFTATPSASAPAPAPALSSAAAAPVVVVTTVPPPPTSVCSAFASIGNSLEGVEVVEDRSCVNGGGVTGRGCIDDVCRYCKTKDTTQSVNYLTCTSFVSSTPSTAASVAVAVAVTLTLAPTAPVTSVAPSSDCVRRVAPGDRDAGISAQTDTSCQFGGLGCFSLECRFCKTHDTKQSSQFAKCGQTAASVVVATTTASTTTATPTTPTTTVVTPAVADACWQWASPGDVAAGIMAMSDAACQRGGLGCLSPSCRFCSMRLTPQSAPYVPCDAISSSTAMPPTTAAPSTAVTPAVAVPQDPCTGLVSSGDVAVGITAVTQPSCGQTGGVGCVTDTCRYCKTRTTTQSAHLVDCTQLIPTTRRLMDEAPSTRVVAAIDVCSHVVSIDENVAGLFGFTDHRCESHHTTDGNTTAPVGCFADACRHCRTDDAALDVFSDEEALEQCPLHVVASSIGDDAIHHDASSLSSVSSAECAVHVSFGDVQAGISAMADADCATNRTEQHGCFARAPCRFCQYRGTPHSAGLPLCPSARSAMPPTCHALPSLLGLPPIVSAVDEPRCNADGRSLVGCVAFSSCRLCATTAWSVLPRCDAMNNGTTVHAVTLTSADRVHGSSDGTATSWSWSPIIVGVVGVACAVAAAAIVAHRRDGRNRLRSQLHATPRSLPRAHDRLHVGVATLSHADDASDFFVL